MKKFVSGMLISLLLTSMLLLRSNVQPVKSRWFGTVYIEPDGRINPPSAPIITSDKVTYILKEDILTTSVAIVVGRNNIIIDGAGCALQGEPGFATTGIQLHGPTEITNVTVRNMQIKNLRVGIEISESSNITVSRNNITNNWYGIWLYCSRNNTIGCNNIANNTYYGIRFRYSSYNIISGNNITSNGEHGVYLSDHSSYNIIYGNNIINNNNGIYIKDSSENLVYHNNFVNKYSQARVSGTGYANIWDNGYPSGGNYWDDYLTRYPNASEIDASGIWNIPYEINANNSDRYPFVNMIPEFSSFLILALFMMVTLLAVIVYRRKCIDFF